MVIVVLKSDKFILVVIIVRKGFGFFELDGFDWVDEECYVKNFLVMEL